MLLHSSGVVQNPGQGAVVFVTLSERQMAVQEASRSAKAVVEMRSSRYEAQTPAAFPAPLLLNWTANGTIHIAQGEESSEVHVQANRTAWQVNLPVFNCCQIHRATPHRTSLLATQVDDSAN